MISLPPWALGLCSHCGEGLQLNSLNLWSLVVLMFHFSYPFCCVGCLSNLFFMTKTLQYYFCSFRRLVLKNGPVVARSNKTSLPRPFHDLSNLVLFRPLAALFSGFRVHPSTAGDCVPSLLDNIIIWMLCKYNMLFMEGQTGIE